MTLFESTTCNFNYSSSTRLSDINYGHKDLLLLSYSTSASRLWHVWAYRPIRKEAYFILLIVVCEVCQFTILKAKCFFVPVNLI